MTSTCINLKQQLLPFRIITSLALLEEDFLLHSPDALVQSAEFSHQLCSTFVLITAEVMYSLNGLGRRLQLIFIDVDSFVLGLNGKKYVVNNELS